MRFLRSATAVARAIDSAPRSTIGSAREPTASALQPLSPAPRSTIGSAREPTASALQPLSSAPRSTIGSAREPTASALRPLSPAPPATIGSAPRIASALRPLGSARAATIGFAIVCLLAASCAPDPLEALDPEAFFRIVPRAAELRRLADGMPYVEGPVWLPDEGALVFSAMQADELKRWRPGQGLDTFRAPSNKANGNALDELGRLVTCEHATRRVSRTLADGTLETLVERYEGARLSSPNDVAVRADGTVWFTDPPYGLAGEPRELAHDFVFRFDPRTDELTIVADDFDLPNGIAFAPDGRTVYVTDSGAPRNVRALDADLVPSPGRVLYRLPADGSRGEPDGLAVARDGTLFVAVGDGLDVVTPAGRRLGTIRVPARDRPVRNVCFGGEHGRTLFLTAGSALLSIEVLIEGF